MLHLRRRAKLDLVTSANSLDGFALACFAQSVSDCGQETAALGNTFCASRVVCVVPLSSIRKVPNSKRDAKRDAKRV